MFRLLIMCLLGLSAMFSQTSGTRASPMDTPLTEIMSMTNEAEGMSAKTKRHHSHPGLPCPQLLQHNSGSYLPPAGPPPAYHKPLVIPSYHGIPRVESIGYQKPQLFQHSGSYLPPAGPSPAYHKPLVIPSYHEGPKVASIGYQKPVVPKIIYQTIQRPAIHHAAYNVQPVKQHVQYIQQQPYVPFVNEHHTSHVKPTVSYGNVQKLYTNYVKPVQHIHPVQPIHPIKTYEIPCEKGPAPLPSVVIKPIERPLIDMHSYYAKQFFQPISYHQKPSIAPKPISIYSSAHAHKEFVYPTNNVVYQKPQLVSHHQPIIKLPSVPRPACEKIHEPHVSYVPQPIVQNVHQPMFQYAPNYHHAAIAHQPMVHFAPKIHHPVVQQPLFHFAQKVHQPAVVEHPVVHYPAKIHHPIEQNAVLHYPQPIVYGNHQHSVSTVGSQVNYNHGHNYQLPIVSHQQPCHK